jgi:hypothetical protein
MYNWDSGNLQIFIYPNNVVFVKSSKSYIMPLNLQCYFIAPCEWKCERRIILQIQQNPESDIDNNSSL